MTIAPADTTYASALAQVQARTIAEARTANRRPDPFAQGLAGTGLPASSAQGPAPASPDKGQVIDLTA